MQKIFFIIVFCTFCVSNLANAMTTNEYVAALEQKLFGVTYLNQSLSNRIDRIEKQIYDNNYSGTPEERLSKIDKIYPKSEFETGKISIAKDANTLNLQNDKWYTQNYPEIEEKADYNNYPIVSQIEQSIYKTNFQGEDIYKRLARLEKELYGNVKTNESLQQRVENLKSVLPKKHYSRFAPQNIGFEDFGLKVPSDYKVSSANNNFQNSFDTSAAMRELEIETFNKSYDNELLSKRLERLENFYFGSISMGQSEEYRINRLASVIMNNKTNGYLQMPKGAQWAGILMNLLVIGLGLLL